MPRVLTVLLVAMMVALGPAKAMADAKTVQVVAIMSDDAFQHAQALTDVLRKAVDHKPGFILGRGEYSLEVLTAALGCPDPPDQVCLEKIARKLRVERYVWGSLKKLPKRQVTAHLSFWEHGSNQRDTTLTYSANLNDAADDALYQIARKAVDELLGPAEGTLVIRARNLNGQVFVNDGPKGKLVQGRAELTVPAGEVNIRVTIDGYRDSLATARVPPGGNAEVKLEPVLTSMPQAADRDRELSPVGPPARSSNVAGYTVVGLGAAVAVAGGVFWYLSYSEQRDRNYEAYRATVPKGQDPCKTAATDNRNDIQDLCSKNQVTRILAFTLTPVGVAVAAVAGVLLATGSSHSERARRAPPVRVTPQVGVGPRGAELELELRF
jgi:hypothetical protein